MEKQTLAEFEAAAANEIQAQNHTVQSYQNAGQNSATDSMQSSVNRIRILHALEQEGHPSRPPAMMEADGVRSGHDGSAAQDDGYLGLHHLQCEPSNEKGAMRNDLEDKIRVLARHHVKQMVAEAEAGATAKRCSK